MWASFPGRLGHRSEGPRCGTSFTGDSGLCPRACGVNQLNTTTRTLVQGTAGSISCPGHSGPAPSARGFDQISRATRARVECPWGRPVLRATRAFTEVSPCRPAVLGDSRPRRCSYGVDSFHGRLVLGSEGPWFRPAVLDESRPCASSQGVHQLSRTSQIWFEGPRGHQLAWTTHARVRGPAGSTSSHG